MKETRVVAMIPCEVQDCKNKAEGTVITVIGDNDKEYVSYILPLEYRMQYIPKKNGKYILCETCVKKNLAGKLE